MKNFLFSVFLLPFCLIAQTRVIFDRKTVGEIRLTIPVKKWDEALDSLRLYGDGMLLGHAKIDGQVYENVGIRYRGNNSYQMGIKRNPFHIKLNYTHPEAQHQGLSNIKLSSALRDPSMVREMLFYEIAGKYIVAPRASFTTLFVNDEYLGVYVHVESIDKEFIQKHLGGTENSLFKAGVDYRKEAPPGCRQNIYGALEYEQNIACYQHNFEAKDNADWNSLQELTRVLNKDIRNIESVIDVDQMLWLLALNNAMVNLNSYLGNYSQNFYLAKDKFGKWRAIPWDLNLAFGSYKNIGTGKDLELKDLQRLDPNLHCDNPLKPLIFNLLKEPHYRKIYHSHIRQIMSENFDNGWYEKRAQEFQSLIVLNFANDPNRFYSLDEFQNSLKQTIGKRSKIPGIVELMEKRSKFLKNHPDLAPLPSEMTQVRVLGRQKFEALRLNAFNISATADRFPKKITCFYRFQDDQPFKTIVMSEDSGADLPPGTKQFSVSIEAKSDDATLQYFLMAENAGTVSYYPANYTLQPIIVKLADLNK